MGFLDVHAVVDRDGFRLDAPLTAAKGETVAVMGPSGAGKSTLLDVIAGLTGVDDGHVRVDGATLSARRQLLAPQRRGVVLLRQDPHLFPHLTARENVAFGLRARGTAKAVALAEAEEWLRLVGMPGKADRRPRELSGGQQQRVALARALVTRPDVLLLDEPFTALDPETASGMRGLLAERLGAADTVAVIVTHDAVDAAALADRLVLLEGGQVTQAGTVREVLAAPATPFGAAVAGVNRLPGEISAGVWTAQPAAAEALRMPAGSCQDGPAVALFPPAAVTLEPLGDARPAAPGEWTASVERLEQTPFGVRVYTANPAVAVDVSVELVAAQSLRAGTAVRLRVPADAVRLLA